MLVFVGPAKSPPTHTSLLGSQEKIFNKIRDRGVEVLTGGRGGGRERLERKLAYSFAVCICMLSSLGVCGGVAKGLARVCSEKEREREEESKQMSK